MKKYLSIILCVALIATTAAIPAFAAGMVTDTMVGSDFENNILGEAVFTENGGNLTYETVAGYDGEDTDVAVIEAPAGDSVSKPSIELTDFNYGNTSLEFDFMASAPIYGDFLEIDFQRPTATANLKMVSADFDEQNPTGGTLSFKNINGVLLTDFYYELDVWYHFEISFEDATSSDALKERIYCFVKVNGTEILNKSTKKDSSNRPMNFVCWNNGSVMTGAKLALNSAKGTGKMYLDNFNVKKTYNQAEVTSAEITDGKIIVAFDKNMKADSFTDNVELYVGSEKKSIAFSGVLTDNVYTITPEILRAGYECTIKLKKGIKCYENGNLKDTDSDEAVLFTKTFSIPMKDVKLVSCDFSESTAVIEDGLDVTVTLENEAISPVSVYGALALYNDGALVDLEFKQIEVKAGAVGDGAQSADFSTDGVGNGAAFYLLDENLIPLCDENVLSGSVLAKENTGVKTEASLCAVYSNVDSSVTVSGKTSANDVVFIAASPTSEVTTETENVKIFDAEKLKAVLHSSDKISAMGQVMADSEGYFELCFSMDAERFNTENYTVAVFTTSGGAAPISASFEYTNPTQLERELGKVNSETNPEEIMDLILLNKVIFELELTGYTEDIKTETGTLIINERPLDGYENPGALEAVLDKAIVVAKAKDKTAALAMINTYFGESVFDGVSEDEKQYTANLVGGVTYTTFKMFEEAFRDAKIVCDASFLETTGEARMLIEDPEKAEIIKPFEDAQISKQYNAVKEKKNIFNLMLNKKYTTIDEIRNIFESAVKSVYEKEKASASHKPSGGGGGGGGGGGSISTKDVENIKPKEENTQMAIFNDIDSVLWAEESIIGLHTMGIVDGDGNGNFRPDDTIKREELIKILVNAFEIGDDSASSDFSDVAKEHWSYKYVSSAYKYGLVQGMGGNTFGSGIMMSRQDLMTLIYRLALSKGMISDDNVKPYLYDDYYEISDYARKAVSYISNTGLNFNIKDNKFNPKNKVSRAEAAATIWGFLKEIKE